MRIYFEAAETVPIDSEISGEFIRADITDKTDAEIAEIRSAIEGIMAGVNYRLTKHTCGHDEGKSCITEEI